MRKAIEDAKRFAWPCPSICQNRLLLSRVFSTDGDGDTSLRFYDTAVPPNPAPEGRGAGFASSGVSATPTAGTLRRARFV
jgi:hypothetical protein